MSRLADRVLVVIPVYGHHRMTHELLADLAQEADVADVVVVDNRGDYPVRDNEDVLRPGQNLGWAGGTNRGTAELRRSEHLGFLWLNNDTRLAPGFVTGLLKAWRSTGAGIIGPFYDCHWIHQRDPCLPQVDHYTPQPKHYRSKFIDGTAMFVPASTITRIGLLDEVTFAPLGWGAEIDYCLAATSAGLDVAVTRLSYLHHERSVTAQTVFAGGYEEYLGRAYPVALEGLTRKWGSDWQKRAGIDPETSQTTLRDRGDQLGLRGHLSRMATRIGR